MKTVTINPNAPPALIYISRTRYTYLGRTQLRIRNFHSGAASLVTSLEGSIKFQTADDSRWISVRSMLIPAGARISIDNRQAVISSCYLDAAQPDFLTLKRQMRAAHGGVYYHHTDEQSLVHHLLSLREEAPSLSEAQRRVESIIYQGGKAERVHIDSRIHHVVERIRSTAAQNLSVRSLAEEVGLSESGLIRLFGQQVGAPLRKHRLWYRLIDFIILALSGTPTSEAIKAAGFTDAAHLSRCYSGFFGVNFSYAFSKNTNVRYIFEDIPTQTVSRNAPTAEMIRAL